MEEVNPVKIKVLFILTGVTMLHVLILTGVSLSGGCNTPSVLGPRPFIKAPPPREEILDSEEIIDSGPKVTITRQRITPRAMQSPPVFELGNPPEGIFYTVKKNDSFWKIARNHGVSMQNLAAYNDMPLNKVLKVGDKLRIPPGGYVVKASKTSKKATKTVSTAKVKPQPLPSDGVYVVKSGDSFWKIAKRYNLKTKTLLDANSMTGKETLSIGQKLIIPDGKNYVAPIAPNATKTTDASLTTILDSVNSPDSAKAPDKPANDNIDGNNDSERAVQVIRDIKVEDFAKQYNISTAMLKKLNDDYPTDGIFKAESVVIIRSE